MRSGNFSENLKKLLIPGTAVLYFAKVFLFSAERKKAMTGATKCAALDLLVLE
jgi:hypothetical protein